MGKKLEEIKWSEEWDVGIMTIDQSHREFVTLLNRVIRTINEDACPVSLSEIFFALIHYAENHFIREEILLRNARYSDLDKHQRKHAAFIEKIRSLREKFSAGDTDVCMELYEYLHQWLLEHILSYDQNALSFLKQQGLT